LELISCDYSNSENLSFSYTIFLHISGSFQGHLAAWMDGSGGEVTLWQHMLERPNFWVEGSVPLRTAEKLSLGNA